MSKTNIKRAPKDQLEVLTPMHERILKTFRSDEGKTRFLLVPSNVNVRLPENNHQMGITRKNGECSCMQWVDPKKDTCTVFSHTASVIAKCIKKVRHAQKNRESAIAYIS